MALYIFFDEAGNLDFSPSGTRYLIFGCVSTEDPADLTGRLTALRYGLFPTEVPPERFHATEDRQAVRDLVFAELQDAEGFEYDAVIVEKPKANPTLHDPVRFYPKFADYLLRYVLDRHTTVEPVILVTDTLPVRKHRRAVEKAFKQALAEHLGERRYAIGHHASAAHPLLQAADYLNWAVFRKWERRDYRSYRLVRRFIRSEFDIFRTGTTLFY